MTKDVFAGIIHNRGLGLELTDHDIFTAKKNNLVVVLHKGYTLKLCGAINHEIPADKFYIADDGMIEHCEDQCVHYVEACQKAIKIEPVAQGGDIFFKTDIPHSTFDIRHEGEISYKGIVFNIKELKPQSA